MKIDMWLPIFISLGLYIPILICASCLPSSLGRDHIDLGLQPAAEATQRGDGYKIIGGSPEQPPDQRSLLSKCISGLSKRWSASVLVIRDNPAVSILFFTLLVTTLANMAFEVLLQFARKRFGWSWSQVSHIAEMPPRSFPLEPCCPEIWAMVLPVFCVAPLCEVSH